MAVPGSLLLALVAFLSPRFRRPCRRLCVGDVTSPISGKPLGYKGSTFHRVIAGFMAQVKKPTASGSWLHPSATQRVYQHATAVYGATDAAISTTF